MVWLGSGVRRDAARLSFSAWKDDWSTRGKLRILAASTYICLASAIPALAFGVQISSETEDALSPVSVLAATAITGVMQALVGGQPLLIVGVAEPIVLTYSYMYSFAKDRDGLGRERFLAWAAWTCVWAAALIFCLALTNACSYISRFTRLSGELFGMLIALLFLQQAIKGSVEEFSGGGSGGSGGGGGSGDPSASASAPTWQLVNGLWSLLLACGLLLACMLVRTARSWRFLRAPLRALLADYGAAVMLVAFSGLSFAVRGGGGGSGGVPRRVQSPNLWDATAGWTVAADMGGLEGRWIAAALIPAALIAVLFFFDHNVSAQLAQQEEFNLQKASAYHYDFLLLGFMTLLCGLLGLPPVNGVLPQAPMHTKALAKVSGKRSRVGRRPPQQPQGEPGTPMGSHVTADGSATPPDVGSLELAGRGARGMHPSPSAQKLLPRTLVGGSSSSSADLGPANGGPPGSAPVAAEAVLQRAAPAAGGGAADQVARDSNGGQEAEVVPVRVYEQRWSGLLQSLGVGACLAAMPAIRQIPTACLWGYFAFMAIESLLGSQFWDRLLLLLTDPACRPALLQRGHAPYLETVPFRTIAYFTLFQLAYLLAVYALTWAGVAGILFPLPIMALVPLRQWVLPRCFAQQRHLQELDAAAEEEAAPLSHEQALQARQGAAEAAAQGLATAARSVGAPAGGQDGEEEDGGALPDSELHRLRVVHHLSRESLIRRHSTMEAEAEAAAAASPLAGAAGPPRATAARLPGAGFSPRAAAGLRRRSHELSHV